MVNTEADAQKAANILHDYGIATVLITLGAKGVWLSEQGKGELIPGFRVQAVDTTAAGDTFTGYFVGEIINGKTPEEALKTAAMASAIAVGKKGASTSIPTIAEVRDSL